MTSQQDHPASSPTVRWDRSRSGWCEPEDAVAVIMSIPAQFIDALERATPPDTTDESSWPRDANGWSALDHVTHVACVFHATTKRLRLVFDQARPTLTPPPADASLTASSTPSVPIVRAALCAAASELARLVNQARPDQWALGAQQDKRTVTAATLLREALDDARNHLGAIEHAPQ